MRNCCECGLFNTKVARGTDNGWIISADGTEDNLHLRTMNQMTGFIRFIEKTFCGGMDAEIYCSFRREMEKD